jgi:hypothetical protein
MRYSVRPCFISVKVVMLPFPSLVTCTGNGVAVAPVTGALGDGAGAGALG